MKEIMSITRKELDSYFGSPMALIFIGGFLAVSLFAFFWVDTFFARGLADVRPLFRWMPILLIFLVGALTMRQWSEEQRSGTLEILLTLPVHPVQLVLGKFVAVMALVVVALALTLFLPISVGLLGNLDPGPVVGGYLAAILLAAAYAALGLFLSSRTDNQIVALISTALLGGLLYLVGSRGVVDFWGGSVAEVLRAVGTGSRFESIERGVIDLRDLVYYLSLAGLFLALNVVSLDSKRWSMGQQTVRYRRNVVLTAVLIGLNLVALNGWLFGINGARLDLTAQREFSLSGTTRDLLSNLEEPLLIRGYFSEKTHPLLAPLVPRIRDTLREYEIAAQGKVVVEVVDPLEEPDKELEANQVYGIRPTPLQAADRYGASVVNAYFDVLIRYGDQSEVLSFRDLIEVEAHRDGSVEVGLRNLEYDLTSAIKKAVYGFQSIDSVLGTLEEPASMTLFVTPGSLPEPLQQAQATIEKVAREIEAESQGKFSFRVVDPDQPGSGLNRQMLLEQYGLQPIPISFFSEQSYYLHMVLQIGDQAQLLYPGGDLSEASVRSSIESAIKRSSTGFLKVVGLWVPAGQASTDPFGQPLPSLARYETIREQLRQGYEVRAVDLSGGQVGADVDVLVAIAPQAMSEAERYAIDQYLMRGGSVVVAAGNYVLEVDPFAGTLGLKGVDGGLREMLGSYGISVGQTLVMDPQNEPFPVQVSRDLGGLQVQEIQAINYPFFVDVRPDGMDAESVVVAGLPAVTMQWASPVEVDAEKNAERQVVTLLRSSPASWLRADSDIQPDLEGYPEWGFPVEGEQASHPLAVSVQGVFESYYKDRASPFEAGGEGSEPGATEAGEAGGPQTPPPAVGTIEESPASARLVVIGSAEFVNDTVFDISAALTRDRYLNNLAFMQNTVDWSVQDLDLLDIRARGSSIRVLAPLTEEQQSFWEGLNYVLALLALVGVGLVWRWRQRNERPLVLSPVEKAENASEIGG
ncbi:MAG: Gldg family protein [Anaerolineales bacterium]|nr:MAG: Gldg family protein [Anaerolineales bacterium]